MKISLRQWDARYAELVAAGLVEPPYGGPLSRHAAQGDRRLLKLAFDDSAAALRLWNFLMTEEERLKAARGAGKKIVGAMKDLGTVPVMAYSFPATVAFYPDGAWWLPCFKELSTDLFAIADGLGIDDSFCPVRAMLGAFVNEAHFPRPDLLVASVGATCDDFSAIAQRLHGLGFPILWWEALHRRPPDRGEEGVELPGGFTVARAQVDFTRGELGRVREALAELAGVAIADAALSAGIRAANEIRSVLVELRECVFTARAAPLPSLELLVAEMLAIHFCSDRAEALAVLRDLRDEARARCAAGAGVLSADAVRIFWVNPVADLYVMNLLEECGGRVCGSEYLFCHALDPIPEDLPPMEALARMALADPMVGSAADRAWRIRRDAERFGAEGIVVSRIPGASHCACEGAVIARIAGEELPVIEIEVPSLTDALRPALRTRLEALIETCRANRGRTNSNGARI
jgi:hypothetical protein